MNILWPIIAPYFWPAFIAYFFSGVYYIIRDVSEPIHNRPSYLSSPSAISVVGVFWLPILIRVLWRSWHRNNMQHFIKDVRKEAIPTLAVFTLLTLEFMYFRSSMF
jgi:4-amino-4-deoxy-L-arabinose transferase-like glycosyltransferase